jgi:hypothetical protein
LLDLLALCRSRILSPEGQEEAVAMVLKQAEARGTTEPQTSINQTRCWGNEHRAPAGTAYSRGIQRMAGCLNELVLCD